jgi:hypothetical protein
MSEWDEQGRSSGSERSSGGRDGDSGGERPPDEPAEPDWDETVDQPHEGEEGQQPI